jgi:hypothetical protein
MVLSEVSTNNLIEAKGVTFVELTIETKNLADAFFVAKVDGNYNVILGRDWIHANKCVPFTLHQMLIQWIGDAVETVHTDTSLVLLWSMPRTLDI